MGNIFTLNQFRDEAAAHRANGKVIGLCHGAYDVLHSGHIEHFLEAKGMCDVLYVTITNDRFILKPGKPVLTAEMRARHLAQISAIEGVAIVDDASAIPAIEAIRPDVYIKGNEYANLELDATGKIVQEKAAVEQWGGRLAFTNGGTVFSSTKIQAEQGMGPYIPMRQGASIREINEALARLRGLRVAVLGELVIDRWASVKQVGVSAKAYCPAVHTVSAIGQVGGAGVVARHLANFVQEVRLFANRGAIQAPENIAHVPVDDGVCTITRYWVPAEEKRLFEEKHITLQGMHERTLGKISAYDPDVLVIADFGYGLISHAQAQQITERLRGRTGLAVMVQSNSSNFGFNRLDKYRNADCYVCDEREASLLIGKHAAPPEELLRESAVRLQGDLPRWEAYMTRGRHGASVLFGERNNFEIREVPNLVRRTVDTIGCGDAFFSIAAACHAAGIAPPLTLTMANMAGAACTQWLCNEQSVTPQHILEIAKVTL
jgi:cytidyltransferase-like protein